MKCYKCDGTGNIEGFVHVCGGKCFLCNGTGKLPELKKKNIGYSQNFIREFMQPGFFPESLQAERVIRIGEEHPTAEKWVMHDADFYYIGKPVCRASGWYKIPTAEWPEFVNHYSKAFKIAI